jgi:hypothetical protein
MISAIAKPGIGFQANEAFIFTGAMASGAWVVDKPTAGQLVHGIAPSDIDEVTPVDVTPFGVGPFSSMVLDNLVYGDELAYSSGSWRKRQIGDQLAGISLKSAVANGAGVVFIFTVKIPASIDATTLTGSINVAHLPAAVQYAQNLTSDAQAQIDTRQASAGFFKSAKITGDGTAQSTPHGLGATPRFVFAGAAKLPIIAGILTLTTTLFTEGTHTSTNCVMTALPGLDYYLLAIL